MTTDELTKLFPQRTFDGIRSRIRVLGLKRDNQHLKKARACFMWTDEELKILKENKDKSVKDLQLLLSARSGNSIRGQLRRLKQGIFDKA